MNIPKYIPRFQSDMDKYVLKQVACGLWVGIALGTLGALILKAVFTFITSLL